MCGREEQSQGNQAAASPKPRTQDDPLSVTVQAYQWLADSAYRRFDDRRRYEWKVTLGVWAAYLVTCSAVLSAEPTNIGQGLKVIGYVLSGGVWFAFSLMWCKGMQRANYSDRRENAMLQERLMDTLGIDHPENFGVPVTSGSVRNWSHGFQIIVTTTLAVLLVGVLWTLPEAPTAEAALPPATTPGLTPATDSPPPPALSEVMTALEQVNGLYSSGLAWLIGVLSVGLVFVGFVIPWYFQRLQLKTFDKMTERHVKNVEERIQSQIEQTQDAADRAQKEITRVSDVIKKTTAAFGITLFKLGGKLGNKGDVSETAGLDWQLEAMAAVIASGDESSILEGLNDIEKVVDSWRESEVTGSMDNQCQKLIGLAEMRQIGSALIERLRSIATKISNLPHERKPSE